MDSCCAAGKPVPDLHDCKGKVINLTDDLRAYQVGNGNKNGIVLMYDIFGFDIPQTRRFADMLAEKSFNVIMPDQFRGKPWKLVDFPPKNRQDLSNWIEEAGSTEIFEKDLKFVLEQLKSTGAVGKPGILGFCWGGRIALTGCNSDEFSCGVSIHGAYINEERAKGLKVPMLFMPSGEDENLEPLMEFLKSNLPDVAEKCVHYRFESMIHGFASARGDWSKPETRESVIKAVDLSADFINRFV